MRKEETSAAVVGSKGVGRKGSVGSARRVVDEGEEEEEGDLRPVRESQIDMFVCADCCAAGPHGLSAPGE